MQLKGSPSSFIHRSILADRPLMFKDFEKDKKDSNVGFLFLNIDPNTCNLR